MDSFASAAPRLPHPQTPGRPCSIAAALALVGEKWALLAVREVALGNRRFDAIARNTGAPRDILTTRLRSLEAVGVLERRRYQDRPPRFEYHLTVPGTDLLPVLQMLAAWGDRWVSDEPPVAYTHQDHEFAAALMCGTCGEEAVAGTVHAHVRAEGWDRRGPVAAAEGN
ncbi:helix-turn-helix domain-containing protein [Yinghuangia aomiensis]|uniref:Helix-turn-helix domain-containing protein n=1 Tax=Yinghuangia aomiensis TaxID=676205 RepID=A0ABP9I396_9ACTN